MGNIFTIALFTKIDTSLNGTINVTEYATIFEQHVYHTVHNIAPIYMIASNIIDPQLGIGIGVELNPQYKVVDLNNNDAPQYELSFRFSTKKVNVWILSAGSTYEIVYATNLPK